MHFMSNYYFTISSLPLGGAFARPQPPPRMRAREHADVAGIYAHASLNIILYNVQSLYINI